MNISELISELMRFREAHGDREIMLLVEGADHQIEDDIADIAFSSRTGFKLIGATVE